MPDMMALPQPHQDMMMRTSKESPRQSNGFPEYLKHAEILGEGCGQLKLTAANSLFHAVLKGRIRGTRLLLDRINSVNGRNDYGYSVLTAALHIDEDRRRAKLFKLLLDRGVDPHFKDETHGRDVLQWACVLGRSEQVQTLLNEVAGDINLHDKDKGGHTALHHAVITGNLDTVTKLVGMHRRFGVSVDVPDQLGLTPYLHAKRLGYRDVAEYLRTEGLASKGHGDMLFRTPREWSQIGKFERKQAAQMLTQEEINAAKVRGEITRVRQLEDHMFSPRRSTNPLPVLVGSSERSPRGLKPPAARHKDRMSMSLPSLQEPAAAYGDHRPHSANGAGADSVDDGQPPADTGAPRPPREAFANGPVPSQNGPQVSNGPLPPGPIRGGPIQHDMPDGDFHVPNTKGPGSIEAFHLMELHNKGKHARGYRQSQFDETKASEYKHMMGTLHSIMEVVSQQQSKSFRQSVKYQRPETPKKKKPIKSKISSLAVIRASGRRRGSNKRSPKASAKKSSKEKKEKGGGGEEKKTKPPHKVVPLLKVNDKLL